MLKSVLLLGNGLNDANNKYKWKDLINDIIDFLDLKGLISIKNKPFPLLYEEIYLANLKTQRISENELKIFISKRINNIKPSHIHSRIYNMNYSDIITTNYDYVIENAFPISNKDISNKGIVKEKTYSVFRYTKIDKTKIWHIHGEVNSPKTILLGYEQYSGQLQYIRNYIVLGTGRTYKQKLPPLAKLLKKNSVGNNSWLDLFFTRDIHIVGLTLDFIESDLWWLITYRARMKLERKLPIHNTITYYYPGNIGRYKKYLLEMLGANEILTKPIGKKHDLSYYEKLFDNINP